MAFRFYLGYYNKKYTETLTSGVVTTSTGVEADSTPTWMTDYSLETSEINMPDDKNMSSLGQQLVQAIGSWVYTDGTNINPSRVFWLAPEIMKGTTSQFTLYYRKNETSDFTPYTSTGSALPAGDYGILFTKVKTPKFSSVKYVNGIGAGELDTDSNITLDCNATDKYFTLKTISGYYIASLEFDTIPDTVDGNSLPYLPTYFNQLGSYNKNPNKRDVLWTSEESKDDDDQDTKSYQVYSLWGFNTFTLIGCLISEQADITMKARCYETDKAPATITSIYKNAADGSNLGTQIHSTAYVAKTVDTDTFFNPTEAGLQWPEAVRFLVPAEAEMQYVTPAEISDPGVAITGLTYNITYQVYPSKFLVNKSTRVGSDAPTHEEIALNIYSDTYVGLFPAFKDYVKTIKDEDGNDSPKTIQVMRDTITNNGTVIKNENIGSTITFKDVYGTSIRTIEGTYQQHIDIEIVYHGTNVYESTDVHALIYTTDTLTANEWTMDAKDLILPEQDPLTADTENLSQTLSTALGWSSSTEVTHDTFIYTKDIDCSISLGGTKDNKKLTFTSKTVDDFFKEGTSPTFYGFKEKNTSYLTGTLKSFLENVPERQIHVYGKMYPAKQASAPNYGVNTSTKVFSLYFELYLKDGITKYPNVNDVSITADMFQYYGRTFTFNNWADYYKQKNNLTFTAGSVTIPYGNCLAHSMFGYEGGQNVGNNKITYTSTFNEPGYRVKLKKQIDTKPVYIPSDAKTVTSVHQAKFYTDYSWPREANTELSLNLPVDFLAYTLNNVIQGGELIMIAPNKRPITTVFNDIPSSDGYLPTRLLSDDLVDGEGVIQNNGNQILEYKYGLNLDGLMGAYCTACGVGWDRDDDAAITKTVDALINNSHAKQPMNQKVSRNKFMLFAVGAGGSGASGDPKAMWGYASGAGGGSGSYGGWFINLEPLTKKGYNMTDCDMTFTGGRGGYRKSGVNENGQDGTDLVITITARGEEIVKITVPAGKGGGRNRGSGGAGGTEPVINKGENKYVFPIISAAGKRGCDGEDNLNYSTDSSIEKVYVQDDDDSHRKVTQGFLENNHTFLGVYFDNARYGKYKTWPDNEKYGSTRSSYKKLSQTKIKKNDWDARKKLLYAEEALKTFYKDNALGCSVFELFLGDLGYQKQIAISEVGLGGTGAPSICGFPTYWLLTDRSDKSSRFPPAAAVTGADQDRYLGRPCYGSGGCGGSATWIDWFDQGPQQATGRAGGCAYWAIFC